MSSKLRLALLISGGGTTMREILAACRDDRLPRVEPACVIASTEEAGGIKKACDGGMSPNDIIVLRPRDFECAEAFGEALIRECDARSVDHIGQYGWLPKTPANVIDRYHGKMTNQHPGPLDPGRPDFGGKGMYGRRVHAARLLFVRSVKRDRWTEVVAQRVHPEFDKGVVIKRMRVPILPGDSPIELQERVLPVEHQVQIAALQDICDDRVQELSLDAPLVRPEEEEILQSAKLVAKQLFPKG